MTLLPLTKLKEIKSKVSINWAMYGVTMEKCDYCGTEVDFTESTSEVGAYCIDCHKLAIDNCQEAIRIIMQKRKDNKSKPDKSKTSTEHLEKQMNDSLADLLNGPPKY